MHDTPLFCRPVFLWYFFILLLPSFTTIAHGKGSPRNRIWRQKLQQKKKIWRIVGQHFMELFLLAGTHLGEKLIGGAKIESILWPHFIMRTRPAAILEALFDWNSPQMTLKFWSLWSVCYRKLLMIWGQLSDSFLFNRPLVRTSTLYNFQKCFVTCICNKN